MTDFFFLKLLGFVPNHLKTKVNIDRLLIVSLIDFTNNQEWYQIQLRLQVILCFKVRIYIYKAKQKDKINGTCRVINSSNDFYGACRHIPRFHRYQRYDPSTDEGWQSRKGCRWIVPGIFCEQDEFPFLRKVSFSKT